MIQDASINPVIGSLLFEFLDIIYILEERLNIGILSVEYSHIRDKVSKIF
jgi:hypothetical protein